MQPILTRPPAAYPMASCGWVDVTQGSRVRRALGGRKAPGDPALHRAEGPLCGCACDGWVGIGKCAFFGR
jgi:hypothetical protein